MEREGLTIQQLASRSGVNPRTIHYYVARGLLPGAGKQGPRTRYPSRVLDMLLEIRQLQMESELTLREIRRRFVDEGKVPVRRPKRAAKAGGRVRRDEEDEAAPGRREPPSESAGASVARGEGVRDDGATYSASASILDALAPGEGTRDGASPEGIPTGAAPDRLLAALKTLVGDRAVPSSGSGDRWVAIPITRDLLLAARRLRPEEQRSLQRAADYLRRILLDTKP